LSLYGSGRNVAVIFPLPFPYLASASESSEMTETPLTSNTNQMSGSYELVLSAVILGLGGLWLDNKFGTSPVLTITLGTLGFLGAVVSLVFRYRHRMAELEAQR